MDKLIVVVLMLTGQTLLPLDDSATGDVKEAQDAIKAAHQEVAKYRMYLGDDTQTELQLVKEPILRWSNHLRRRFYGDVFIWTHEGRPEAVATITNVYGDTHAIETEAHSLSLTKFTTTREEKPMWNPAIAGVELRKVPDAPPVADDATRRLSQMRGIARQFSASSSKREKTLPLRLLPQPIYRYTINTPDVTDGAMFAFTNGTDPDIFLLIEARPLRGAMVWHFSLARFNAHVKLQAFYNYKPVWTVEQLSGKTLKNPESTYFAFRRRDPDDGK